MKTHKFARKPFYVDAVRVSDANIEEVAQWCGGKIVTEHADGKHISVEVHRPINERQTQAFVGDWVLFAGSGYKVYTPKAFDKSFEKVKTLTKAQADEAGIKVPHEPRSKKRAIPRPPRNPVLSQEQAEKVQVTQKGTGATFMVDKAELELSHKQVAEIGKAAEENPPATKDEAEALIQEVLNTPLPGDQS